MEGGVEGSVSEGEVIGPEIGGVSKTISHLLITQLEPLEAKDFFENLYDENTKSENWKLRTQQEKESIFQNYKILKSGRNVIAGLALKNYQLGEQKGKLIECLWGKPEYDGAGSQIIQKAFELIPEGESLFAYSSQAIFFEKCGFVQVPGEVSSTGNPLYQKKK